MSATIAKPQKTIAIPKRRKDEDGIVSAAARTRLMASGNTA